MLPPPERWMRVRVARCADIAGVRSLLADLWDVTYRPLLGPAQADALHERWHAPDVLARQIGNPANSFLVVDDGCGGIVAHAYASANASLLLVARLYVSIPHQARGLGTRLLVDLCRRHPHARRIRLYVAEGNEPALGFYERRGFRRVGRAEAEGVASLRLESAIPLGGGARL